MWAVEMTKENSLRCMPSMQPQTSTAILYVRNHDEYFWILLHAPLIIITGQHFRGIFSSHIRLGRYQPKLTIFTLNLHFEWFSSFFSLHKLKKIARHHKTSADIMSAAYVHKGCMYKYSNLSNSDCLIHFSAETMWVHKQQSLY